MNKIIGSLFTISLFVSCGNQSLPSPKKEVVKTIKATSVSTISERNYSFIAQPYHTSELSFRIGGPIQKLDIQSGQYFRKGQLIAEVDNRDYIVKNEQAQAIFNRAEADYTRISNLFWKGNISETNYEKAKADYKQTEANLTKSQNDLKDTQLIAPFDGYIQAVHVECFQDIKPSSSIVTFIDLSKIKLEVYVPEQVAIDFSQGDKSAVEITFNTRQPETFTPSEIFVSQSTSDNNISYCLTAIIDNCGSTQNYKLPYINS